MLSPVTIRDLIFAYMTAKVWQPVPPGSTGKVMYNRLGKSLSFSLMQRPIRLYFLPMFVFLRSLEVLMATIDLLV